MKKLFYCLLVAFGFSLLATSCEKDPSGGESDIIGAWMWEKTLYEDGEWEYAEDDDWDDWDDYLVFYEDGEGAFVFYDRSDDEYIFDEFFEWELKGDSLVVFFEDGRETLDVIKLTSKEFVVEVDGEVEYYKKVKGLDIF